jgi:hypothetical protein
MNNQSKCDRITSEVDNGRHPIRHRRQESQIAVMIDLRKYGELWQDIYDSMLARVRANEPRESLASVKKRLRKQGKLDG